MNDGNDGARLRDEGIERAVAHADRVHGSWADKAGEAFACFLTATNSTDRFMSDDVIDYAYGLGLPKPPDGRAWGGIIMAARKAGKIVKCGYADSPNPKHHKAPSAIWRKV